MNKKLLLLLVSFGFFAQYSFAQNVNYQLEVRYLGWDGRSDQSGTPEYAYLVTPTDNVNGAGATTCFYYGDDLPGTDNNGSVTSIAGGNFNVINQSARIRTINNTSATSIAVNLTAYEKDCSNNCTYNPGCNCVFILGCLTEDDDLAQCSGLTSVAFKNQPPCQWNDYSIVRCGSYTLAIRVRWEYAAVSAGVISKKSYSFCGLGDPTQINDSITGSQYVSYQWQFRDNCTGTWNDIPGATAVSYDPPAGLTTARCYQRVATVCQINGSSISAASNSNQVVLTSGITGNTVANSANFCATTAPAQGLTGGAVTDGVHTDYLYDWQVSTDGVNFSSVQASSTILNYTTGTLSTTTYYRRKTCPAQDNDLGGPAPAFCIGSCDNYSNVITIGVTPPITNNTILGTQTVCDITDPSVLTGSLPAGGTGTFVYQWQQAGAVGGPFTNIFGANSQSYDPSSLLVTTFYRRVITSGVCSSTSGVVSVTVVPEITGNTIAGGQAYCGAGDAPAFTAPLPGGGTGTFTYLWEQSTTGIGGWSPASGTSNLLGYDPPSVAVTTYYRRTVFSGSVPCTSISNPVAIVITAPISNNTINSNQINCDTLQVPNLQSGATPNGGNGIFSYFWQQSTDGGLTWAGIAGSLTQNYQPTAVGQTTVFRRVVNSSVCADTSNRDTITIVPAIKNNVIDGYQKFCGPGNPVNIVGQTATGGTGTLAYTWESSPDGSTWSPIVGANGPSYDPPSVLSFTTYYHRIVKSSVCSTTSNVSTVSILKIPVVSQLIKTDLTCFKSANGTISVAGNSFNGGISYSIDSTVSYQSSGNYTGLSVDTYYVYVKDDSGCVNNYNSNPVILTQPDSLYFTFTTTDASCANILNGQINITATGGTPIYNYSLNNGSVQSSNVFGSLGAGSYLITLFDKNACTDTATAVINNSYIVSLAIDSQQNVTCNGDANGLVRVKLTGGTAPITYSINGVFFQSSPLFTGLSGGNYIVTAKDAKGCTDFVTVNTLEPQVLTVKIDSTINNQCYGGTTGSIFITVNGGTPPYTYLWSNGATTDNIRGLAAGTYTVTVTDFNLCTVSGGATITQPQLLDVNIASSGDVKCNGDSTGYIDISATGATPPYFYLWSNGATSEDVYNLKAGNYRVTVTDVNGCEKLATKTIFEPSAIISSVTSTTDVTCAGANDGAITVSVSGGVTPYTFQWSNGTTSQNLSGVAGGIYNLVITDRNGCKSYLSDTIAQPASLTVTVDSVINSLCNGGTGGAIYTTAAGGNGSYTYTWSNTASTDDVTGLLAGTYTLTVKDVNGCSAVTSATIAQPLPLFINIAAFNDVKCNGDSTGAIDISATGGVPPYSYLWSNGAVTEDISNLIIGTYTVTVTDTNGCQKTTSQVIGEPLALIASIDSTTDVTCAGASNGAINVSVSGGVTPYSFIWSNGSTTQSISGIAGGLYTLAITDKNGCKAYLDTTVAEPLPILISITGTNVNCKGGSTGTATASATGGTPTYTFAWSNGGSTGSLTGLAAGTYIVTVTDTKGCAKVDSVKVTEPALVLSVTTTKQDAACAGVSNGSAAANVTGGTFPYTYTWSNGSTNSSISNLGGGTYDVTVQDANGCTAFGSVTINQSAAMTSVISGVKNVSCFGGNDGAATVTPSGGQTPYTYLWNTFQNTATVTDFAAGLHYVIITDSNGCEKRDSIIISEPTELKLAINGTNVNCKGGSTGTATASATGGTPTYTFAWSNGGSTGSLTGLAAGTYIVTVTDTKGCAKVDSVKVTEPALVLSVTTTKQDAACAGVSNGSAAANVTGGTFPYTYTWSNGSTNSSISNLGGGTYDVTVQDANGCTAFGSVTINQSAAMTSVISGVKNVSCFGGNDGAATVTPSGGQTPYTYLWNTFQNTATVTDFAAGLHYVIITDSNGCEKRDSIIISEPTELKLAINGTNVNCKGGSTGTATASATGGTPTYTFAWSNGGSTGSLTGLAAGTYIVTVTDTKGCAKVDSVKVTEPALVLSVTTTKQDASCAGVSNGLINAVASGGTLPYTFLWSNGSSSPTITNLAASTYTVTATDLGGCTTTASVTIGQKSVITSSITGTNVKCFGQTTGATDLTVNGGTKPYTYLWSTFQGAEDLSQIGAGTYYVIITDSLGCERKDSIVISQPTQLVANIALRNISCNNLNDDTLTLTVSGGTPTYTYKWSNSATTKDLFNVPGTNTYAVTATDQNSCTATASALVINPAPIDLNEEVTQPKCFGYKTGAIDLIVSGGVPQYTYQWNSNANNATTQDVANLLGDSVYYVVTVTDSKGCKAVDSVFMTQPGNLSTNGYIRNVRCSGDKDGIIQTFVSGGVQPYTIQWYEDSVNTPWISGPQGPITDFWEKRPGGQYWISVTDVNGCNATSLYIVKEPAKLTLSLTKKDATCQGANTGSVTAIVSGGSKPYQYLWNNFATDSFQSAVSGGVYTLLLTDSNGCRATDSITVVGQPAILFTNLSVSSPTCSDGNNGFASIAVSGGAIPYSYNWNTATPQTGATATNLNGGVYVVTVTDKAGCQKVDTANVVAPTPIVVSNTGNGVSCLNAGSGFVVLSVTGGKAPYIFQMNGISQGTDTFRGLAPGTYTAVVRDANGCEGTSTFTIVPSTTISVDLIADHEVVLAGQEVKLFANETSDTTVTSFSWIPSDSLDFTACGTPTLCNNPTATPRQTQTYIVTVTNARGCSASDTVRVEVSNDKSAFFPAAFTPNADGLNDRFEFDILGATNADVQVWNRWGEKVYSNPTQQNGIHQGGANGWDGTFRGKACEFGTYTYQIEVTYFDGHTEMKAGTLILMK